MFRVFGGFGGLHLGLVTSSSWVLDEGGLEFTSLIMRLGVMFVQEA